MLAGASYYLEPYQRILLGVSGGVLLGLALAAAFGLDSTCGALIGGALAFVLSYDAKNKGRNRTMIWSSATDPYNVA